MAYGRFENVTMSDRHEMSDLTRADWSRGDN